MVPSRINSSEDLGHPAIQQFEREAWWVSGIETEQDHATAGTE
jgi:hypothetical protein